MGTIWFLVWSVLIIIVQASGLMTADEPPCTPGFESKIFTFKVTREQLRRGARIGEVNFSDCTDHTRFLFASDDDHFMVQTDGALVVRRPVVLHEGRRDFFIHSWDSQGQEITVPVTLLLCGNHHGNHNPQKQANKKGFENNTEVPSRPFRKSGEGPRRRKRSWLIPSLNIAENHRGPFPLLLVQIRSTEDKVKKFQYSITGPGADQSPVGLFTMDTDSGKLYITASVDRESQDKYMFQLHTVEEGSMNAGEAIEIIVNVIDQNDNKPVFGKDTYVGEVSESSTKGSEVIKIEATDLDEPGNYNSDIRYSIVSQEPEEPSPSMFIINPETGVISVNADGFDRKNHPQYTLRVEAADMQGDGLTAFATVSLTVTERDGNASPLSSAADEGLKRRRRAVQPDVTRISVPWKERGPRHPGNLTRVFRSTEGLIRMKRDWVIPPLSIPENHRGPYPVLISAIRSDKDRGKKIFYSITGPGADQSPVNLFTVDRVSGRLYVTSTLDREKQDRYMLQVHAVTEGAGNAEVPMNIIINVIDQNDNKPVFAQSIFLGMVPESSPIGFEVVSIKATDADEPDTENSAIRYRILSQDPEFPSRSMFTINPITGVISVGAGGLDRAKCPRYTLTVQAADYEGEGLSALATVILTVADSNSNAPAISLPASGSKIILVVPEIMIAENNKGPYPMKLAQVRSVEDGVKKIHYSITGPGADQPPVDLFTMDRDTGDLYITESIDRESQDKYILQVHAVAEGEGNAEESTEVVVKVIDQNDNKPVFKKDNYMGEVAETSPNGLEVIQVEASDADERNTDNSDVQYRIVSQDPQEPDPSMFFINPVTGVIRVNAAGLDRQKHSQYTLVVEAADMSGDGLITQTRVILTVTAKTQPSAGGGQRTRRDIRPDVMRIPSSSVPWRERLPRAPWNIPHYFTPGEELTRRKRRVCIPPIPVDENHEGPYPLLIHFWASDIKAQFSISGPGADQPPVGLFTMDRDNGDMYVTQPLDRETREHYWLETTVVVEGHSPHSFTFTVEVHDVNDNKPVFSQDTFLGYVPEASPKGFEVIRVVATDADDQFSDNSRLRFCIMSQEPQEPSPSMFEINPVDGVIRVNADGLDREKHPQYTLVVEAADMKGKGLSTQAKVVLTITTPISNQTESEIAVSQPTSLPDPEQKLPADRTLEQPAASDPDSAGKHKDVPKDKRLLFVKNSKYKVLMLLLNPQQLIP
ncbi:cadherin-1 [Kryptolebias marmoratus]|uniref:Cadherin-1-like n=1 Tax=Kryptolebias marmoratus TaxID=37003 RepID=A0A3Q3B3W8_KRYMA|nr:cadherin-1 [Kryptolebias marmoratus]